MTVKNNVTRMLDAKKIAYTAHVLPVEKRSALDTADLIGVSPDLVYKSIVAVRPERGKPILGIVPAPSELDLKALAVAVGEKKVKLATHDQAEKITGLQTGGISPLALVNKGFEVVIDDSAQSSPHIYLSGGQRGLSIQIAADDAAKLVNAKFALIAAHNYAPPQIFS